MALKVSPRALISHFMPDRTPQKPSRARHKNPLQHAILDSLEPRTLLSASAVTGLTGTPGTIYLTTAPVTFTWANADTVATQNLLEVKEAGSSNWFVLAQIAGNATSFTTPSNDNFSVDATYQVRMTTVDPSGAATSSAVTVVIPPWTNAPSVTTTVSTDSIDGTTYDILNWDEPDNSDIQYLWYNRSVSNPFPSRWHGFTVAYDSDGTPGFYTNGYDSAWSTQGEDGAWEYGGDNAVLFDDNANVDGVNAFDPTAAQKFTTTAPTFSFEAPTLSATYNANNSATLSISGDADPDNGDIYIVTENSDTVTTDNSVLVTTAGGSPHSWGRSGEYFVYQENDDDNYNLPDDLPPSGDVPVEYSAPSNWVDVAKAFAPSFLQVSPDGDGTSANIVWENTAYNETGYQLQRSTDGTNWSTLTTTGADVDQYEDSNLTAGTTYDYRVKAVRDSIGDGTLDSNFITTTMTAPDTEITDISYDATDHNAIHTITKDPTVANPNPGTYSMSGTDSNHDHTIDATTGDVSSPIWYTRNAAPKITATFSLKAPTGPNFSIRGTTQGGLSITLTMIGHTYGTTTATATFTGGTLPNSVDLDTLDIKWQVTYDGTTWVNAGESKTKVYISLADPVTTDTSGSAIPEYETELNIGCNKANGKTTLADTVNAISTYFAGRNVTGLDGTQLNYWGSFAGPNQSDDSDFYTAAALLIHHDGRCGAWGAFFSQILAIQGIHSEEDDITPDAGNVAPPDSGPTGATFHVVGLDVNSSHPAQGNAAPQHFFKDHVVIKINVDGIPTIIDPSYGTKFTGTTDVAAETAWENGSLVGISGYWIDSSGKKVAVGISPELTGTKRVNFTPFANY